MKEVTLKQIKFNESDALVWYHPCEEVDENTVIICPHTHEVIFLKGGAMLETLLPGEHRPIPVEPKKFLKKKVIKKYYTKYAFVNVTSTLNVLWGTPNRVDLFDPFLDIPVQLGMHGSFIIRINNARKFIEKLGGLSKTYTTENLNEFFRDIMLTYIKDSLATVMIKEKITYYQIWSEVRRISNGILEDLAPKFDKYGVELCELNIVDISIPEDVKRMVEKVYKEKYELTSRGSSFEEVKQEQKEKENLLREDALLEKEREFTKEMTKLNNDVKHEEKPLGAKYCGKCGEALEPGKNFCVHCGTKVVLETLKCPYCGKENSGNTPYCGHCGKKIVE